MVAGADQSQIRVFNDVTMLDDVTLWLRAGGNRMCKLLSMLLLG